MSYIPTKDADLINWGANFSSLLTADPALYGLLPTDALVIQTNFDEFQTAYTTAIDPSTRTIVTVAAKDEERAGFLSLARAYAAIIRANQGVDPADKAALGLTIPDPTPTPIPPPATPPVLVAPLAGPGQLLLAIADSLTPTQKAKPFGVAGALLYRKTGQTAPTDPAGAEVIMILTRADNIISTSDVIVGNYATYWAKWFNRKGELGPLSAGVTMIAI